MSQSRFNMCRICLAEPEPEHLPFVHIMTLIDGESKFQNLLQNLLGINIGPNNGKPDEICKICAEALDTWDKMRMKASDHQIVLNYMSSKRSKQVLPGESFASTSSSMLRHNEESSQESPFETSRIPSNQFVNDDCIDVTPPIEVIELISDDEGGEYDIEKIVELSSDSEDNDDLTNTYLNNVTHRLENQAKNVTAASMKLKKPTKNKTELLPVKINNKKNVMLRTNRNVKKIPRTSKHVLFTCLKPSCNEIFASFTNFKHHYRRHSKLGSALVCWQCCKPFTDLHDLRVHQVRNNCRTPGMYKCFKCSSKFDDVESLSIHKLTFHDGKLMNSQRNKKTIRCAFCKMCINIFDFTSHLVKCKKKNEKNNAYTCLICKKVFRSGLSLSNHSRVHRPSRINSNVIKE